MSVLVRRSVEPHPWRLHQWSDLDGLVGIGGIARQCQRCWVVEVWNGFTNATVRGSHEMLNDGNGSQS